MNKITRENYEEFILDYADNLLPAGLNKEMESFLNLHPDIASEVLTFRNLKMTPDPTVKFLDKESLLQPVAPKSRQLYPRLLKVAAVGILLAGMGVYLCFDEKSDSREEYSQVNDNTTEIYSEEVGDQEETEKPEVKTSEEVAVKDEARNKLQKQSAIAKVTPESVKPSVRQQSDVKRTQTQKQLKTDNLTSDAKVNGPVYQPSRVSRTQDHAQVSRISPVQASKSDETEGFETVKGLETEVNSSLATVESLAAVESLPLSQELKSVSPQSLDAKSLKFNDNRESKNKILNSIIKGTRLSQIALDDISESLIPSFAFSEVQFVPTYLKK